ncbi:MAG: tRNA (adenosine(37)-N6)-threonylcarbamoyltransferase complex ATPase subunit type 1 TsaE [Ignavibacteria bacterium]|nr:tRNA (adenosine(37)-N6)-threonylcarbamoyltransferase complex ATPase subunit type 1 TsaE [Ignavibacteria bacterium]
MRGKFISKSESETFEFGKKFSSSLKKGDLVALIGELGSGKTIFVKGICSGLNAIETPLSPTFSLINKYHGEAIIYHFDFYRIKSIQELYDIGYEDYFYSKEICLIEWANLVREILPKNYIEVKFKNLETENEREITIRDIAQ